MEHGGKEYKIECRNNATLYSTLDLNKNCHINIHRAKRGGKRDHSVFLDNL